MKPYAKPTLTRVGDVERVTLNNHQPSGTGVHWGKSGPFTDGNSHTPSSHVPHGHHHHHHHH